MDPVTLALILEIGVPLLIKLLNDGKENKEAVELAKAAVSGLNNKDIAEKIVASTPEEKDAIVDSLYSVVVGAGNALTGLFASLSKLGK